MSKLPEQTRKTLEAAKIGMSKQVKDALVHAEAVAKRGGFRGVRIVTGTCLYCGGTTKEPDPPSAFVFEPKSKETRRATDNQVVLHAPCPSCRGRPNDAKAIDDIESNLRRLTMRAKSKGGLR